MIMDRVTEFVAHFIGVLHIAVEEERLRDAYEEFKALRMMDPEAGALLNVNVRVSSPYALEDFTPDINYQPSEPVLPAEVTQTYFPYYLNGDLPFLSVSAPFVQYDDPMLVMPTQFQIGAVNLTLVYTLPLPSSAITVTYQTASLTDNDELRFDQGVEFVAPEVHLATLNQWALVADALNGPSTEPFEINDGKAHDYALGLMAQAAATDDTSPVTGATVTVVHGTAVIGHHQNGEQVDELPKLQDLLPKYLRAEDVDEEEDPGEAAFLNVSSASEMYDVDPGHNVVTGGNLAANDSYIATAWLDAPVIAVMGDAINLDVIRQTNVLVEHDVLSLQGGVEAGFSATYNVASFLYESSQPAEDPEAEADPDGAEDGTEEADLGLPQDWVVVRLEADVTLVNWVHQYTFATDFDRAEVSFSADETFIGLGENTVFNLASFLELGFGYDLIIIGGHMISVNMIVQTNVLLDSDHVTYSGDMAFSTSGLDNLLYNEASIRSVGVDQHHEMTDAFAAAGADLANGAQDIGADVAQDSLFEGTSLLRVLYIDGDFTTLNIVEQTNIFGDNDQVHMALADFENATGAEVTLTTGSNALTNSAKINEYGVDSEIMVAGDVYEDALLYQAELVDTDANPLGVGVSDLASEAVVYLADHMLTDATPETELAAPTIEDGSTSPDVMQVMLA